MKPGSKKCRLNVIDAWRNGKLIAPMVFEGACDHFVFEAWVEHCLLPVLVPGDTVVADNASFHKSLKARQLIENAGCTLKFLPVRSPDMNPIEHCWFPIKNAIRKLLPLNDRNLIKCAEIVFQNNYSGSCA